MSAEPDSKLDLDRRLPGPSAHPAPALAPHHQRLRPRPAATGPAPGRAAGRAGLDPGRPFRHPPPDRQAARAGSIRARSPASCRAGAAFSPGWAARSPWPPIRSRACARPSAPRPCRAHCRSMTPCNWWRPRAPRRRPSRSRPSCATARCSSCCIRAACGCPNWPAWTWAPARPRLARLARILNREVIVTGKGNKMRTVPVGAAGAGRAGGLAGGASRPRRRQRRPVPVSRGTRVSAARDPAAAESPRRGQPARRSTCIRTCCATRLPRTCCSPRATCARCRNAGPRQHHSTQVYTSLDFQHLAAVYDKAHPRAKLQVDGQPGRVLIRLNRANC
jgi:hypothetical protein